MSEKYICPVCGFDGLKEPPYSQENEPSYEICPCCGFEFGFSGENDVEVFTAFRNHWLERGAKWFMQKHRPANWDMQKQLDNLNKL
jgi:hypothetical protein